MSINDTIDANIFTFMLLLRSDTIQVVHTDASGRQAV